MKAMSALIMVGNNLSFLYSALCVLKRLGDSFFVTPHPKVEEKGEARERREGILCKYLHAPFVICLARLEPGDTLRRHQSLLPAFFSFINGNRLSFL